GGQPGEDRRDVLAADLQRVAGDDADELLARRQQRREGDHVVLDDDVRVDLLDDLLEPRLAVLGAVDQLLVDRGGDGLQLLTGALAVLRPGVADEVLPELARVRVLLLFGRRREVDELLPEALGFELALPGRLRREDDPVAAAAEDVGDADAVVGGAVGAFRPEQDGERHGVLRRGSCVLNGNSITHLAQRSTSGHYGSRIPECKANSGKRRRRWPSVRAAVTGAST